MARSIMRTPAPAPGRGPGLVLLGVLGTFAAAWLWSRRREAALHRRTAARLRPLGARDAA